jgi:hypothetical protein
MVPWNMPSLPQAGVVVDGRKLHRCLRAAGDGAQLNVLGEGARLEIRFGSRRFTLACDPTVPEILRPDPDVSYAYIRPSVVALAALFAGPDKTEPPELSGVHIAGGAALACDRRGLIAAIGATDNTAIQVTIPHDAFDGLSVGDGGEERVAFGLTKHGHLVIADPRTGEWRVLVSWGANFPDVRGVLARMDAKLFVDVDKAALVSALKQFRLVQTAGSSVKINVWSTPPMNENGQPNQNAGDWMEMRGGDPGNECEFVARLGVSIQRTTPLGEPGAAGMYRVCIALDELLKVAQSSRGTTARLGFGADERSPLVVKNELAEIGVMPMAG